MVDSVEGGSAIVGRRRRAGHVLPTCRVPDHARPSRHVRAGDPTGERGVL